MVEKKKKFHIVFAAAECTPFAKVGGLGDVIGSLPQALAHLNVTVTVILPKYGSINPRSFKLKKKYSGLTADHDGKKQTFSVYEARLPKNPVRYLFIDHTFFKGNYVYEIKKSFPATKKSIAYSRSYTDIERFSFFSQAVVELINQKKIKTDILHCQDWHTALIPSYVDELAVIKNYPFTKTILTIHNLANQGIAPREFISKMDLKKSATPYLLEDYYDHDHEKLNLMKLGILSADMVTTVSPNYAKEILTSEYGASLEEYLGRRRKDLYGIVNGIDTTFFNPSKDKNVKKTFTSKTVKEGKRINKQALQKKVGLPVSDVPVYGLVSRLVTQKGLDILEQSLHTFIQQDVQVVLLGTGMPEYERAFKKLGQAHKEKVAAIIDFDITLAQQIYAGSDFFLMPSRFEPCGLGQMIAMQYGTIPIVRATGGLKDTVAHMKNGVVFKEYTHTALTKALSQSLRLYRDSRKRYTVIKRAMTEDFSWDRSAREYLSLYKKLV